MTDPTHPTPEELKDIAAAEEREGVVDQQSANEVATPHPKIDRAPPPLRSPDQRRRRRSRRNSPRFSNASNISPGPSGSSTSFSASHASTLLSSGTS
jgi:hypothetical protein